MSALNPVQNTNPILSAIKAASTKTGVDFDYLLATAQRESSLNPQAKSKSSSAAGLFQFVERTWIDMVDRYGDKLGLDKLTDGIERRPDGRQFVADAQKRSEILALRHDPQIASYMAAEYTRESASALEAKLGRTAKSEELYLAHFFGAGTAARFIQSLEKSAQTPAATLFPRAAGANKSVFFHSDGTAKSLQDVYDHLVGKHLAAPAVGTPAKNVVADVLRGPLGGDDTSFSLGVPSGTNASYANLDHPVPGRLGAALVLSPDIIELLAEVEKLPGEQSSKNNT